MRDERRRKGMKKAAKEKEIKEVWQRELGEWEMFKLHGIALYLSIVQVSKFQVLPFSK